jgi:hypothetical protein
LQCRQAAARIGSTIPSNTRDLRAYYPMRCLPIAIAARSLVG